MKMGNPPCQFQRIQHLHRNMHTLSIPYPTRATLTYTAPVWDCALNLIVLQPPLPTRRSIPVLPWDPAPLWPHRELFHHNTTLANSVFYFPPLN